MTIVRCDNNKRGLNSFYINCDGKSYFLFSQQYHKGVNSYFSRGVRLNAAMDIRLASRDHCVIRTMNKMKPFIKYIEKEYDLKILDTTKNKGVINKKAYSRNDKSQMCLKRM